MLVEFQTKLIFLERLLRNIQILNFKYFGWLNPSYCNYKERHGGANCHKCVKSPKIVSRFSNVSLTFRMKLLTFTVN